MKSCPKDTIVLISCGGLQLPKRGFIDTSYTDCITYYDGNNWETDFMDNFKYWQPISGMTPVFGPWENGPP